MRRVAFPAPAGTSGATEISVLGFGCAALGGRASRAESLRSLEAANDAGINFFDTARSYGYGTSEAILGNFLASGGSARREASIVCTKFGIVPAPRNWKHFVKPIARAAVRLVPSLRGAAQRQAANQLQGGNFTKSTLKFSFEQSLRSLGTTYADMLLLHSAPASVLQQDDLLEAMQRLIEEGKVRMAGISAEPPVIAEFFSARPTQLSTAQFPLNISNMAFVAKTSQHRDLFLVANHPFGGPTGVAGTRDFLAELSASGVLSEDLCRKLDLDDPQLLPEVIFHIVLHETGVTAVVPAMMKATHIAGNVRALESCRFSPSELVELRHAIASQAQSMTSRAQR